MPPAAPGGSAIPGPRPNVVQAPEAGHGLNIYLINWMVYDHLSEIKLIRTDTTLDLSQRPRRYEGGSTDALLVTMEAGAQYGSFYQRLLNWDSNPVDQYCW